MYHRLPMGHVNLTVRIMFFIRVSFTYFLNFFVLATFPALCTSSCVLHLSFHRIARDLPVSRRLIDFKVAVL